MGRQVRRSRTQQGGFTLLELVIALAVMMIGLLALWGLHAAAITSNANAYRLGISTTLAHDALEQLMGETWTMTGAGPVTNARLDPAQCGGIFPAASIDGLEPLPCNIDLGGARVNGIGAIAASPEAALAPVIFLRTYHSQELTAGFGDRLLIRVRVTYDDPHTGKRHGVTIGTTRLVDTYNPLGMT